MLLGEVRAAVSAPLFLSEVLKRTRASGGDVPFAIDGEGNLYTPSPELAGRLEGIREFLHTCAAQESLHHAEAFGDWLVVTRRDPESDLTVGVVRPIAGPLARIRTTAARNLGLGVGMIGLALLGILPLSSRMTRSLHHLAESSRQLASGDLSVRAQVRSTDEIGELALAFNRMASDLAVNQERLLEKELQQRLLVTENERKSRELEEARSFQLSLLPGRVPELPGLEVAVFTRPAAEVGGDYYDFHEEKDGSLIVAIGDATGHGARAATMVTVIKSLFTSQVEGRGPAEFLGEATRAIQAMRLGRRAMALQLLRVAPPNAGQRRVVLSSAGMPPLLVHRARSGQLEEIALEGLPLGAMKQARYAERETVLDAGDCLLLMSDGFPELENEQGDVYGYARVHALLASLAGEGCQGVIDRLAEEVARFSRGGPPSDDVTFVVLKLV